MATVEIKRIVVASPIDVQAERNALPTVLEELNNGIGRDRGFRLELARWETDAFPSFHPEGPQRLIDAILRIEDCDVLMGIFWKRFGTPVSDAKSGTEHEFRRGYEAWKQTGRPQIMVYFNQRAYTPQTKAETEQWGQVLAFRESFPKEGLWWPYRGKPQFERLVRNHLTQFILQHTSRPDEKRPPPVPVSQPFEPEMILIPAGEFLMGSNPQQDEFADYDEQPQHPLYLPDYYLAKIPVTNAQYREFVRATGHEAPQGWTNGTPSPDLEDHPVVNVPCFDARDYCQWLSQVTGKDYSLPSEAEWEKGARGTDGRIYPWDNQWEATRCNSLESGLGEITSVHAYPQGASPYGVLDMAGNVWEWTRSLWGRHVQRPDSDYRYPYKATDGRENLAAGQDVGRVVRGGALDVDRRFVRCAYREGNSPNTSGEAVGFRVVVLPAS